MPIIFGSWPEEGIDVTCVGGKPTRDTLGRIDVSFPLGNAPHLPTESFLQDIGN